MDIRHVVVLMLENRSFDSMLGMLYPSGDGFAGLTGSESNTWHKPDGSQQVIRVWSDPVASSRALYIPDPDPGELFADINAQIYGLAEEHDAPASTPPTMGGFVDNYMCQKATGPGPRPLWCHALLHARAGAGHQPAGSRLRRLRPLACIRTLPDLAKPFFVHTGTANGYVNNSPTHFPYQMETVFNRLAGVRQSWRDLFPRHPASGDPGRSLG